MEASDGKLVTVKLKMPLRDVLSDIVEVYGVVDDRGHINCINYATFDQSVYENFGEFFVYIFIFRCLFLIFFTLDMELYNETIKMALQLPRIFIQATN